MDMLLGTLEGINLLQTIITTGVLAALGFLVRIVNTGIKNHDLSHELLKDANLYQIKSTLLFMYHNARDRGTITAHELSVFNDLYSVYKRLGGNGFIETLNRKVQLLEITHEE